eukprot:TRINITY_DN13120_c0_g1_i1.p1 TRINITY_DN13120_c0_g1~~TRINITY_DN13120_c0_g1_i1.p1  ORF type:complete len:640 (-),score=139.43 TRINITY_DN13120_c0_g1_i1:131-2050(-)
MACLNINQMLFLLFLLLAGMCAGSGWDLGLVARINGGVEGIGPECTLDLVNMLGHFISNKTFYNHFYKSGKGINELGHYRECEEMGGNYVTFNLEIPLPIFTLGVCLPKKCRAADFVWISRIVVDSVNAGGGIAGKNATLSFAPIYDVTQNNAKNTRMDAGAVVTICLVAGFVLLAVVALILEHPHLLANTAVGGVKGAIACFNIAKNSKGLFQDANRVDPNLDVFNGLRVISMLWIILGHSLAQLIMSTPTGNLLSFINQLQERRSLLLFTAGIYAVDTFFILSGFFAAFSCYSVYSRPRTKFFPTFISLIVQRYIRLFPIYLITFLTFMFILPKLYDGPISTRILPLQMGCRDNWVGNFLYYNNYFKVQHMCMQWTWYIANDFQLFLLVPIISYIYCKSKKFGMGLIGVLSVVSIILQLWCVIHYEVSLDFMSEGYIRYNDKYYYMTYCRCIPYFIGIVFAWMYISYKSPNDKVSPFEFLNTKIKENTAVRYAIYAVGLVTCIVNIALYPNNYLNSEAPHSVYNLAVFLAICHTTFPLGVMLVIYPALVGRFRGLKPFMGCKVFNVLAKLTYSAYMFHMAFYYFYNSSMSEAFHFSIYGLTMISLDVFVFVYLISLPVSLLFESPVIKLSKYIFRKK